MKRRMQIERGDVYALRYDCRRTGHPTMFASLNRKPQTAKPGGALGNFLPSSSVRQADHALDAAQTSPSWDPRTISTFPAASSVPPVAAQDTAKEREANEIAGRKVQGHASHPLLERGAARARIHTGAAAASAAARLEAAAFTVGDDIMFGAGRYQPHTAAGQHLLAHEAVHVAQQAGSGVRAVQRQPAMQMPPATITSNAPVESSVSHLDRLQGAGVTSNMPGLAHTDADIERNTPRADEALPFTPSGWDGTAILQKLGQYDRIAGTDSDAVRCVQAVGMAARVTDGPLSVTSYLSSMVLQGMLSAQMTPRMHTAIEVLKKVKDRIQAKVATFGDLSWAQEALHDLFYDDVSGTPLGDIPGQISPAMDLTKNMQHMDVWCDNPLQVMREAGKLKSGEQLLIEEWTVTLNTTFEQLEDDQKITVPVGGSTTVDINGKNVVIHRTTSDKRPPARDLDFNRDSRLGHQLLIVKDASSGGLRLYEPETTDSGKHFEGLAADGSNLTSYFGDQPKFGMYRYIEIIGKLQPGLTSSLEGPGSKTAP